MSEIKNWKPVRELLQGAFNKKQLPQMLQALRALQETCEREAWYSLVLLIEEACLALQATGDERAWSVLQQVLLTFESLVERLRAGGEDNPSLIAPLLNEFRVLQGRALFSANALFFPKSTPAVCLRAILDSTKRCFALGLQGLQGSNHSLAWARIQHAIDQQLEEADSSESAKFWQVITVYVNALQAGELQLTPVHMQLMSGLEKLVREEEGEEVNAQQLMEHILYYLAAFPSDNDYRARVCEAFSFSETLYAPGSIHNAEILQHAYKQVLELCQTLHRLYLPQTELCLQDSQQQQAYVALLSVSDRLYCCCQFGLARQVSEFLSKGWELISQEIERQLESIESIIESKIIQEERPPVLDSSVERKPTKIQARQLSPIEQHYLDEVFDLLSSLLVAWSAWQMESLQEALQQMQALFAKLAILAEQAGDQELQRLANCSETILQLTCESPFLLDEEVSELIDKACDVIPAVAESYSTGECLEVELSSLCQDIEQKGQALADYTEEEVASSESDDERLESELRQSFVRELDSLITDMTVQIRQGYLAGQVELSNDVSLGWYHALRALIGKARIAGLSEVAGSCHALVEELTSRETKAEDEFWLRVTRGLQALRLALDGYKYGQPLQPCGALAPRNYHLQAQQEEVQPQSMYVLRALCHLKGEAVTVAIPLSFIETLSKPKAGSVLKYDEVLDHQGERGGDCLTVSLIRRGESARRIARKCPLY